MAEQGVTHFAMEASSHGIDQRRLDGVRLAASGFGGVVVLEVSTRRCRTRAEREALLAESLLFARLHLRATAAPAP